MAHDPRCEYRSTAFVTRVGLLGVASALLGGGCLAAVTETELVEAVRNTVCLVDRGEGVQPSFVFGDLDRCAPADLAEPLAQAIDAAYTRAHGLLVAVPGVFSFMPPETTTLLTIENPAQREKSVREAFVAEGALFRQIMLPRIEQGLAAQGVPCTDCRPGPRAAVREVSLDQLFPYVSAFIWVSDDVRHTNERGEPLEKPLFRFRTCSGENGLGALQRDPLLVRAGMAVATALRELAVREFRALQTTARFSRLRSDRARVDYLRRELPVRLRAAPEFSSVVVQACQEVEDVLGIRISR